MRSVRIFSVVAVLGTALAITSAFAQSRMRTGSKGNADQQQPGFSELKKKEEKRFPLGQSWIAVSMNGKAFSGGERPAFAVDDMFRVRGFGGCNSFTTTAFPLREQGIAVGPLALTRRNCDKTVMAAETSFLTALRTSAKWDTQVGSLTIKGPNGELKFERSL